MLNGAALRQRGMNLVEVLVTLAILSVLLLMGGPTFSDWLSNSRIRTTAESILAGMQLAKAEAVSRNTRVRFQLTSSIDNGCALDPAGRNWVVSRDPLSDPTEVEGACADRLPADNPIVLHSRPAAEGSANVQVRADQASVVFNGVGRPVPIPAGTITIDVASPGAGTCANIGGPLTCLRILVAPGGQVRMCNPVYPAGDPQAC